jgi:choline dehydrogenase-like flavoprotein
MHPLSRGTVHIGSSNPLAPPLIDPNYFGNEADLDLLVHITKLTLKLVATPPMAGIVRSHVLPSSDVVGDKVKLRQYVKENSGPVFHPVGTAAMLPREDGGVVDSELRVYGTNKLRVVSSERCFYLLGWLNNICCTGRSFYSSNGIRSCTFLIFHL